MASHRVQITYERVVTFYVDADSVEDVYGFLDSHPDWNPGDVQGLIDVVGEEVEVGYDVSIESKITPNFEITEDLEIRELDQ